MNRGSSHQGRGKDRNGGESVAERNFVHAEALGGKKVGIFDEVK